MGKQFSVLMTPNDVRALEEQLLKFDDVIFKAQPTPTNLQTLPPLDSLAIDLEMMGKVPLECYLIPKKLPQYLAITKRTAGTRADLNEGLSHAMEFVRPYQENNSIRAGRFYFVEKVVIDGQWQQKDAAFCEWANKLFRCVKRQLTRVTNERVAYYAGQEALVLLLQKKLNVIN